jgi:hypothetical protein
MSEDHFSPRIRDNKDIPKKDRDPDVILSRMDHFWSDHGIRDVTTPGNKLSGKEFGFHGDASSGEAGGLDVGFEGGLTPLQTAKLEMADPLPEFRPKDLADEDEAAWLRGVRSRPTHDRNMIDLGRHLTPVTITRFSGQDKVEPFWEEHANRVSENLQSFNEQADYRRINKPGLHREVINYVDKLPTKGPGFKQPSSIEDASPHFLGGQFAYVSYAPHNTKDTSDFRFGGLVSGYNVHDDIIDLRTGSWANLNRDGYTQ